MIKSVLIAIVLMASASSFAKTTWPSKMPKACAKKLRYSEGIRYGSVQSTPAQIVGNLQADWIENANERYANYEECGSSDFYYVKVDKVTCQVVESDSGDSDGECY